MSDILYSVIIPLYNSQNTIGRTLDSIINQKGNWKNRIEIIVCNDRSTDESAAAAENFLKENAEGFNWKIITTDESKPHGPGNARQAGIDIATGEWITFVDADDLYDLNAFENIEKQIIQNADNKNLKLIASQFVEWDMNKNQPLAVFNIDFAWVHGKWYKREYLKEFNISFKEDLFTHEDCYFNNIFLVHLNKEDIREDFVFTPQMTYKWILNDSSITRALYDGHTYLEKYFKDYIDSQFEPALIILNQYGKKEMSEVKFFSLLLFCYFYFQGFCYIQGDKIIRENISYIKDIIKTIIDSFNLDLEGIINRIYSDPIMYKSIKMQSEGGTGPIVELMSFKEFINVIYTNN